MKAILIYVPAIHKGYIDFFRKNPSSQIFLLDLSLVREMPRMERDIRAMDTEDVAKALSGMGFSNINVFQKENIKELEEAEEIVMLEDDVSDEFLKKNFKNHKNIKRESIFLRWDRNSSLKELAINTSKEVTQDEFSRDFLNIAEEESKKSHDWWRQIGAVIVKDNKVLMSGFNRPLPSSDTHNIFGDPRSNFDYGEYFELSKFIHAEADIIARAAKKGLSLDGSSLYVTTFPCPVCAKLVAVAGIKKVYFKEGYSKLDAEDILKSFSVEIIKIR